MLQIEARHIDDMRRKIEYSSNKPVYIGVNREVRAATSDAQWLIWKLTWDGDDMTDMQGPMRGSWDNRASMDW